MTNNDTKILIAHAYFSRWSGYTLMIDYIGNIYLGKNASYSAAKFNGGPAYYDNSDGDVMFLSNNQRLKYLMAGKDFTVSQDELIAVKFFTVNDYIEFTQLLDGVLANFPNGDIMKFAGDEFERYYIEI